MKRLFRGLRQAPAKRYDAVVVGAGIGGLFSANLLAKQGLAVLLVEQHYMVGGYCSTFKRAGYTFDAASHFYPMLGNPQTLTGRLLDELGIRTQWVAMDPVDTFHFPDGTSFEVPADLETYRARLAAQFPHQREQLEQFFKAAREAYLAGLVYYFRGQLGARFEHYQHWTVRDALDRYFSDAKLKLLLTADCPHWGGPPERTSFVFDSMLRLAYFLGNYYPVGGSQAFADELARRFEELGGDVLMSTSVERIESERQAGSLRVTGVSMTTTRGGLRGRYSVKTERVVCNADLMQTLDVLAPEAFSPTEARRMRELRPSFPCFLTHLGLRDVSRERLEAIQGYYWNEWDPDLVGKGGLACKIFVPTLYEPCMAPEGGHIVVLQKVLEQHHDTGGTKDISSSETGAWPAQKGSARQWSAHKADIESVVMNQLRTVFPSVDEHIVTKCSASALTSWRFTGNHEGAMLGWEMSPDQLGEGRPGIESAMGGLYFVGHWVRPGGGITPVIVSAMNVAKRIGQNG